jgi:translation initiation factor IF-3
MPNKAPANKGNLINEEIRANELRVIDEKGEQAGIMLLETAQQMADNRKLDLVLISPNAKPPVAKIMDYGKYRYEQQKRDKEARKKQKVIQVKEIRLSTFIEKHDLVVKANNAEKFLREGDKVKVSLRFKGRERGRTEKGFEVMERFAALTESAGAPEKRPAFEGRSLIMILAPLPDRENKAAKPKNRDRTGSKDAQGGADQTQTGNAGAEAGN